jgi:hypothetical protein
VKRSLLFTLFRRDLGRKLVALGLALLVWWQISVHLSDSKVVTLDVEITSLRSEAEQASRGRKGLFIVVPDQLITRNVTHSQVTVELRGLKAEVDILEQTLSMVLEVPGDALGQEDEAAYRFDLDRSLLRSPGGTVNVKDVVIRPKQLTLTLAERTTEAFDLGSDNVQISGAPRTGHFVSSDDCRVEPNQVELTGPRSVIASLRADPSLLKLEAIDVEGQALDVVRQVGLDWSVVDPGITLGTSGGLVSVMVPVRPDDFERELLSVPVRYDQEASLATDNVRLVEATDSLDLLVVGPRSVLDGYTDAQLKRAIRLVFDWRDVGELKMATDQVRVLTDLPSSVDVLGFDGREPEIHYQLAPIDPEAEAEAATETTSDSPGEAP